MAEGFPIRHRFLLLVLWAQVPALAVLGLLAGVDLAVVVAICLAVIASAIGGMLLSGRKAPATLVSVGLTVSACSVVSFSGDAAATHLYFPVILVAIASYRMLAPLAAGLVGMGLYHLVVGFTSREGLVPFALHTGFLFLITGFVVVGWRIGVATDQREESAGDRYRRGFHSAPIGMAVLKPSGEFLEANVAMSNLLGFESGHFPGRNIRAFVHTDDMPILGEAWEAIGNGRDETYSAWLRCLTGEGGSIWARASLALVPRTGSQNAMVILAIEDATGAYQEQDRLQRLVHGKDEFVAVVGMEIQEPLGMVVDLTSGDPELLEIHSRAQEAASVVDDLVASARAEIAPPDVVPDRFDIAQIGRRLLSAIPGGDRVALDVRAGKAWADPDLTTQILTGMLGNTIRYGGPHVRMQIFNSGADTVVQIIDDGPVIPTAARDRIFSGDLRQGEPVTRPAALGLSLTVGRYLARRMDGDVTYRRSGDGFNIFELRLPTEDLTERFRRRPRPNLSRATD